MNMGVRYFRIIVWTLASLTLPIIFGPSLWAADKEGCGGIENDIRHGEVIWTQNAILVQGTSAPNLSDSNVPIATIKRASKRAATLDAYRKAAGVLYGVRVSSDTLVAENKKVTAQINAFLQNPKICKAKYYADGGVDIVAKFPLKGEIVKKLLPNIGSRTANGPSSYTGLMVDATGLDFVPALVPKLLSPDGAVLFGPEMVKISTIDRGYAVTYIDDPGKAETAVVGSNPLRVSAIGLGTTSPSDLILDPEDAAALAGVPAFLGEGKVVVLFSPKQRYDFRQLAGKVKQRMVDWERRLVLVRGYGKVNFNKKADDAVRMRMMERAAEVDAQSRLLEALQQIKVNGKKSLKDMPHASQRISGVVVNAIRCGAKYFRDGTAEVVLAAPIDGVIHMGMTPKAKPASAPSLTPSPGKAGFTSVIVDATKLDFQPVLAPMLMTPDSRLVYGPSVVSKSYAQEYGVVGYASSIEMARTEPRVGANPMIIKAEAVDQDDSILVLSDNDAGKIESADGMKGVLSKGKVVIVTDYFMTGKINIQQSTSALAMLE
jgi:hypothetical protein